MSEVRGLIHGQTLKMFNGKYVELRTISGEEAKGRLDVTFHKRTYHPETEGMEPGSVKSLVITKDDGSIFTVSHNLIEWIHERRVDEVHDRRTYQPIQNEGDNGDM